VAPAAGLCRLDGVLQVADDDGVAKAISLRSSAGGEIADARATPWQTAAAWPRVAAAPAPSHVGDTSLRWRNSVTSSGPVTACGRMIGEVGLQRLAVNEMGPVNSTRRRGPRRYCRRPVPMLNMSWSAFRVATVAPISLCQLSPRSDRAEA